MGRAARRRAPLRVRQRRGPGNCGQFPAQCLPRQRAGKRREQASAGCSRPVVERHEFKERLLGRRLLRRRREVHRSPDVCVCEQAGHLAASVYYCILVRGLRKRGLRQAVGSCWQGPCRVRWKKLCKRSGVDRHCVVCGARPADVARVSAGVTMDPFRPRRRTRIRAALSAAVLSVLGSAAGFSAPGGRGRRPAAAAAARPQRAEPRRRAELREAVASCPRWPRGPDAVHARQR